jgi:hypothetical protein
LLAAEEDARWEVEDVRTLVRRVEDGVDVQVPNSGLQLAPHYEA